MNLLIQLLFTSKIDIPVLSRWWKTLSCSRTVLLGCACHHLFSSLSPSDYNSGQAQWNDAAAEQAEADSNWHAEHGRRVRLTHQYLNASLTVPSLFIYVQTATVQQRIMSWLMRYDNHLGYNLGKGAVPQAEVFDEQFYGQAALEVEQGASVIRSREEVVAAFVDPTVSPLWLALHAGCEMLYPAYEGRYWQTLWRYTAGRSDHWIFNIWACLLALLGRLWWKMSLPLLAWPYRLFRILSDDEAIKQEVAADWGATKCEHCLGDLLDLHKTFPKEEDTKLPEFLAVVREMVSQVDFSIFDVEINHHDNRADLDRGVGNSKLIETTSLNHQARSVASQHDRLRRGPVGQAPPRARGPAKDKSCRKFISGYSMFLEMNPCDSSAAVASGEHARQCSVRWKALSEEEKETYTALAASERKKALAAPAEAAVPSQGPAESFWDLGSKEVPFKRDLAFAANQAPADDEGDSARAEGWSTRIHEPVANQEVIKNTEVQYARPCCEYGVCCIQQAARWDLLENLCKQFHAETKALPAQDMEAGRMLWLLRGRRGGDPGDGEDVQAGGSDGDYAQVFLFLFQQKSPYILLLLGMELLQYDGTVGSFAEWLGNPDKFPP